MQNVLTNYTTAQESFWAGDFGDEYIGRNDLTPEALAGQLHFFAKALDRVRPSPASLIEFGANIGLNLRALKLLYPSAFQACVEINAQAVARMRKDRVGDEIIHDSILSFEPARRYDLAYIKGVLIHLDPSALPDTYRKLAACSARYVLIAEYYNRRAEELIYRGNTGKLFRRDFGGDFIDHCPEFSLVDYGFSYHRDTSARQDDLTWFLLERKN